MWSKPIPFFHGTLISFQTKTTYFLINDKFKLSSINYNFGKFISVTECYSFPVLYFYKEKSDVLVNVFFLYCGIKGSNIWNSVNQYFPTDQSMMPQNHALNDLLKIHKKPVGFNWTKFKKLTDNVSDSTLRLTSRKPSQF